MTGILADNDVEGHLERLVDRWQSPVWREVWLGLNLQVHTFEDLGLARNTPDTIVWQVCQQHAIALITGNRHREGPQSLEAAIQAQNTPHSLPVFTIGDPRRLLRDKAYLERTAERLLEYFLEIDRVLGAGRLYVP